MARFVTVLRDAIGQAIIDTLGPSVFLRLYTAAYTTLLIEFVGDDVEFAPAPATGLIVAHPFASGVAVETGAAAVARLVLLDGSTVIIDELSVSDSLGTGQVKLAQTGTTITLGAVHGVTSVMLTVGNAT